MAVVVRARAHNFRQITAHANVRRQRHDNHMVSAVGT